MSTYITQVLIAVDQLGNALLAGWADETLSSRSYRQNKKMRWRIMEKVINTIFFFQPDHCRQAYEAEINRKQTFPLPENRV
jgi:hypothetical protein